MHRTCYLSLQIATASSFLQKQLIAGFGFRVTGCYPDDGNGIATANTKSVLVTSKDSNGIQIIATCKNSEDNGYEDENDEKYHHFDACKYHGTRVNIVISDMLLSD